MKHYEICKATVEDYLMLLGFSRIKIQAAERPDEDIVIPTALSIRQAYIVTKSLDRLFSKPRCALRLAGYLCRLDGVEAIINEIKDLQAERKEAFEPFAKLCEETESGISVRPGKPCKEWLDAVARFNSLLTREELLFRLILSTVAANVKDGKFQRAEDKPVEQLLTKLKDGHTDADRKRDDETHEAATSTRRATTVDDRKVYAAYKNLYVVDPKYKSCKKDMCKKRGPKQFYDYFKDDHLVCGQFFQKTLGEKYPTLEDFERAMDAVRQNNKYRKKKDNNRDLLSRGEPKVDRKWRSAIPSA